MSSRRSSGSWLASPPPSVAVEITAARIVAVSMGEHAGSRTVTAHASEPLPAGAVVPTLNAPNVHDEKAAAAAMASALQKLGHRTRRIALVVPDAAAKVSLVRFEKVPQKLQDLEQLIRWQMRKAAPFRIEDAQLAWHAAAIGADGGREYLVTAARRDVVRGYEAVCDAAGVHAGLVDIASFNQVNAVLGAGTVAGDWLLVNVATDHATLVVVRGEDVISFRNRAISGDADLADLVHQTAMYHEDRLGGGGFSRVVLAGISTLGPAEGDRLRRLLSERIGALVEPIDFRPGAEMRDRIAAGADLVDMLAAPVGVLLRERAPGNDARRGRERVA